MRIKKLSFFLVLSFFGFTLFSDNALAITRAQCQGTPGADCTSGVMTCPSDKSSIGTCTFSVLGIGGADGACCAPAKKNNCNTDPGKNDRMCGTCNVPGVSGRDLAPAYDCGNSPCCSANPNDTGLSNGATGPTSLNYTLLEQIPGSNNWRGDLPSYLKNLYKFAFWAIGIAALLMLSVGGFMYATSAGNTSRMGTAKTIIFDSLLGIVIAILAWLFLYVINPDLVKINLPTITPAPVTVAPPGPTPPVTGTGCGGLNVVGISTSQCSDASQELSNLLACIKSKDSSIKITSISDSAGFDTCKTNWTDPVCAHSQISCHYGGGKLQTSPQCQKSHAADLSIRDTNGNISSTVKDKVISAATSCSARINIEGSHIHVSTSTPCCRL